MVALRYSLRSCSGRTLHTAHCTPQIRQCNLVPCRHAVGRFRLGSRPHRGDGLVGRTAAAGAGGDRRGGNPKPQALNPKPETRNPTCKRIDVWYRELLHYMFQPVRLHNGSIQCIRICHSPCPQSLNNENVPQV